MKRKTRRKIRVKLRNQLTKNALNKRILEAIVTGSIPPAIGFTYTKNQ